MSLYILCFIRLKSIFCLFQTIWVQLEVQFVISIYLICFDLDLDLLITCQALMNKLAFNPSKDLIEEWEEIYFSESVIDNF